MFDLIYERTLDLPVPSYFFKKKQAGVHGKQAYIELLSH